MHAFRDVRHVGVSGAALAAAAIPQARGVPQRAR